VRKFAVLALIQFGFLTACGGGGGYTTPPPPPPTQVIAPTGPPNVETLTVNAGPAAGFGSVNIAYTSVQVCNPTTGACQTIPDIEVDTGSIGLRLLASAMNGLILPAETNGTNPLAECLKFADGSSWGSLATANITLPVSGETAAGVHVQIIGDPAYPAIPSDCPGPAENTVPAFGANGILGVGPYLQDCGSLCVTVVVSGTYYQCPAPSTCAGTTATLLEQVQNPVSMFATDNNGVIIELPSVGSAGAATISGSLVFGIGTRTNNGLGSATVLLFDPNTGGIQATYKSTTYTGGYIDSGANGNFFTDSTLTQCMTATTPPQPTGFFCPASTMMETATLKGTGAATLTANFSVANADTLFSNNTYTAFSNLAGPILNPPPATMPQPFDLGLSFFYGVNVFTAIEGATTPGGVGPYFAY
jgi:hypothetical protein